MKTMPTRPSVLPTVSGFAGAVLVAAGSFGAGWLGSDSAVLSWPIVAALRASAWITVVCSALVVVGGVVLIAAWLRLRRIAFSDRPDALRIVLRSALLWAAPLLVSVPLFSRDLYAYVGQGRLMAAGLDPYTAGIATLPGWFALGVDPMWANTATPYGPVWLWIEQLSVVVSGAGSPDESVAILRVVAVVSVVALVYYAVRLALRSGASAPVAAWFVGASPLVLTTLVVSGHNDGLMLALVVAALFYARTSRPILAILLVALAIGVKPIAVLALPIVGILWVGEHAALTERVRAWAISAAVAAGILAVAGIAVGVGFGWIVALQSPSTTLHWYAPLTVPVLTANALTDALGLPEGVGGAVVRALAMIVAGSIVTWLMLSRARIEPGTRMVLAFLAMVLASTAIHPWYVLWIVVLSAVRGFSTTGGRHLAVIATIFFACASIGDRLGLDQTVLAESEWAPDVVSIIVLVLVAAAGVALASDYAREERLTVSGVLASLVGPLRERTPSMVRTPRPIRDRVGSVGRAAPRADSGRRSP